MTATKEPGIGIGSRDGKVIVTFGGSGERLLEPQAAIRLAYALLREAIMVEPK